MTLFIADDSMLMRERIRNHVIAIHDVTIVGEAANGKSALDQILLLLPDLVILDIHMPELNGIAVLKNIRAQNLQTQICILTNYNYPQYKERCLNLGANYFLCKSQDFEKTTGIILKIIAGKRESAVQAD